MAATLRFGFSEFPSGAPKLTIATRVPSDARAIHHQ